MGVRGGPIGGSFFPAGAALADDLLLAGLAEGDAQLSVAFVRRFQRKVFGVAVAVLGDASLAEDVAQQAFERAWRHAALFDPRRGTVGGWLAGITHNLAVDVVRSRRPAPIDPGDIEALLGAVTRTPEGVALASESAAEVRAAIRELPVEQARALVLSAYRGLTAREVAEVEGIPLGTAKTRIRTAMLRLHAALEPGRNGS
ncbi:sigma-70 family RNA polymerase sigma factor [Pseudonocardia ailaonensis]|uniref:Sigma-70 family RNA polymerase sigma factor n=1 Tax=Pseudonocardia ailaonensis TaxID=367279 RepID=A0ABN2MRJ6_9PSEU